jgi:hypothetical protein
MARSADPFIGRDIPLLARTFDVDVDVKACARCGGS